MKNYEKYLDEIIANLGISGVSCYFLKNKVHKKNDCGGINCVDCSKRFKEWLKEEYNPQIDWSKVPVDTPVLVWDTNGAVKKELHFAMYMPAAEYKYKVFDYGDKWTEAKSIVGFKNCELIREEDIEKYSI